MITIGIDPGIERIGVGVVESNSGKMRLLAHELIKTPSSMTTAERLSMLYDKLTDFIKEYKADNAAVEELFFAKNVKTGIAVAHARGVILLTAIKECGKIFEYTPLQIKQALTGYGRAEKNQIQQMVKTMLSLKSIPRPDDAADALAVALCHAQTNKLGGLFSI